MKTDVSLAKISDCCYVIWGILKSGISTRQAWNLTQYIGSDQNHHQGKEMQQGKMVGWGGLTKNWEKERSER